MNQINEKLVELKSKIKEKERLKKQFDRVKEQQKDLEIEKNKLYQQLKKEELDVEKMEGLSIASIIHSFLGDKVEKIDKEKKEAINAKFKYDAKSSELDSMVKQITEIEGRIRVLGDLESEYNELIKEKERLVQYSSKDVMKKLDTLAESQANLLNKRKELKEALDAGRILMSSLLRIKESLQSASNWGVWDMFGGGMISTMAKHSRIDDAKSEINTAQTLLSRFHRELQDVGGTIDINIEIGSFLTFADYFFDGIFADWAVQSRINESKGMVEDTINKVRNIMSKMDRELNETYREYDKLEEERLNIIENA